MQRHWHKKNFPVTASCCNKVKGGIDGLITGHAYSFLEIADLKDSSGKIVHTIAKVRNPWGSEKYSGPFSDDDDSWTKEWSDQVDLKVADDGIFWMPYKNFLKFFRKADVAYTGNYKHAVKKFTPTVRQSKLVVNNPVDQ
jgi:hypothetical protein